MSKRQITTIASVVLLLVIAVIGVATYISSRSGGANSADNYKFVDSRYEGISSKIDTRETKKEKVAIEYPITGNSTIDETVAHAIDSEYESFHALAEEGPAADEVPSFTAGYQITTNTEHYLSIAVNVSHDSLGAESATSSFFWTFDKRSGHALKLRGLFDDPDLGVAEVVELSRAEARKILDKQEKQPGNVADFLDQEQFEYFMVDHGALFFPLHKGAVLPSSYGDLDIRIEVDELRDLVKEEVSRELFGFQQTIKAAPTEPAVSRSCAGERCIAITFDDGPGDYTRKLLGILGTHDVKATFFVVGEQVHNNKALTKRIVKAGHQIGNHTWNHPDLTTQTPEAIHKQLADTNAVIREATGVDPHLMRPPYGALNPTAIREIRGTGMASILWNIDTKDWADLDSTIVCNRAVASAKPGSIILMHDVHKTTVDAVPCVIGELSKLGFRFVTIDELLGETTPGTLYFSAS